MYKIDINLYDVFIRKMLVDQGHSTELQDLDKVQGMSYGKYLRDKKKGYITQERKDRLEILGLDVGIFIVDDIV